MLMVLLVFLALNVVNAPGDFSEPIYVGVSHNESWSPDSQAFVFYDTSVLGAESGVVLSLPAWLRYDVLKDDLNASRVWPLQPDLSDFEAQRFDIASNSEGLPSFIYQSPDTRFLVYAHGERPDEYGRWPIAIADRHRGQIFELPINVWDPWPFIGPVVFKVIWSADSTAFAVSFATDSGSPVFVHVGNFVIDLKKVEINWFHIQVGERIYFPVDDDDMLLDLSANGNQVLLVSSTESTATRDVNDKAHKLLLWTPTNPSESLIIDSIDGSDIESASFVPNDESALLIVNYNGLIQYDIAAETITVLRLDLAGLSTRKTLFSPDGRWLAVITDSNVFTVATSEISLQP